MTITHVPNAVLPLNDATVDALCREVLELDRPFGETRLVLGPMSRGFQRRCELQETLNELAPNKGGA